MIFSMWLCQQQYEIYYFVAFIITDKMVETKHMQKTITRNDYARQNRIRSRLPVHCFRFYFGPLHKTEKYPFHSIHRA